MNNARNNQLERITIGHSLPPLDFAPVFVADALGYYRDEGLEIDTVFNPNRQRPIQGLIDGQVDCLLTGPSRTFDLEHRGIRPPAPSFVVIVHRCHFYLMGLEPEPDFQLENLQGKRVILYGASPPPNLLLKHLLRIAGIPLESVNWLEGIVGDEQIRALEQGEGDYAILTQPEVDQLVHEGRAYVVVSMPDLLGPFQVATVVAPRRFLDERPHAARGLVRAIQRTKDWMARQSIQTLTDVMVPLVPGVERVVLEKIVHRTVAEEHWFGRPSMARLHYEWLKRAYTTESNVHEPVPFTEGVYNRYADEIEAEFREHLGGKASRSR